MYDNIDWNQYPGFRNFLIGICIVGLFIFYLMEPSQQEFVCNTKKCEVVSKNFLGIVISNKKINDVINNIRKFIGKYKNIMYLPAINYSQLQQLEYYKKQNFGFKALNWDNFEFYKQIPKFLDEETGVNLVVSNIKEYLKNDYTEKVSKVVKEFLIEKQDAFFETRKDYINNFSKSASSDIAKTIYTENKGGEDE